MNALTYLSEQRYLTMNTNCYCDCEFITAWYLCQIYSIKTDGSIKDSWCDKIEIKKKVYSTEIDNQSEAIWIDL